MKIRLDDARFEPCSWQEKVQLTAEEVGFGELLELGAVECAGSITFSSPDFLLRAHLSYVQSVSCNRCLKPVRLEVEDDLELLVRERRAGPAGTRGEQGLEEADLGTLEVVDQVDTRPLIVEQVQLNLPMKPLCREDCRGLCPLCGRDLNDGPCGCAADRIDPRWGALAALKAGAEGGTKREN